MTVATIERMEVRKNEDDEDKKNEKNILYLLEWL